MLMGYWRIFVFSGMEFNEASRMNYDHPIRNISNYSNGECSYNLNISIHWDPIDEDYYQVTEDGYYEVIEDDGYEICEREVKQKTVEEKQRKLTTKSWEPMYGGTKRKFQEKGLNMPEIVFWNLNNSPVMLVPSNQDGVALVSRFSKNLMQLFLDNGGSIDPVTVMEKSISGDSL
ncbi:hypothetical protein REPUB_Repub20aG0102200 [Reevesia pubescens]